MPKKIYYTLVEASQLSGVKYHILRYWDKEFKIRKKRNKNSLQRYHRDELKKILKIKNYLYTQGYTIAGAKKRLTDEKDKPQEIKDVDCRKLFLRIKKGLKSIETMLN